MLRQRIRDIRNGNTEGGFTLIELLIVIVVLGILAGIVVFGVATFRSDATLAACKATSRRSPWRRTPTPPGMAATRPQSGRPAAP